MKSLEILDDTESRDEELIQLIMQAYRGEILCTMAMAEMGAIKPFSDYKPTVNEGYRKYFNREGQE